MATKMVATWRVVDDRAFSKSGKILKYLTIFINLFCVHIVFINVDYI